MQRAFILGMMIVSILLISCGGGGPKVQMPAEGIRLSYVPAVNKTNDYRIMVQKYIQASEQGNSINQLIKGDVKLSISIVSADNNGNAKLTYKFNDVAVGQFVNNQIQSSEDIDEMKELELSITVDSAGTRIDDDDFDMDEEMQKAAKAISPTEFILEFPMPDTNVTFNYTWHDEIDTVRDEENSKITQKVVTDYKVLDFVMLDSARVIVCQYTGTYNVTQKGVTEYEGKEYDVDMTMTGDIKGKVSFDIDNGRIVKYEYNKMIDVKGKQKDMDTGEEQPIVYYNQITIDARLESK